MLLCSPPQLFFIKQTVVSQICNVHLKNKESFQNYLPNQHDVRMGEGL